MIVLLPPSETKRDGGDTTASIDWSALSFPSLTEARHKIADALVELAQDPAASRTALGISEKQLFEVDRNRSLTSAPVAPALERYTGVLYDGLDALSLTETERTFAGKAIVIHSALFGLISASDPIPPYRLSHNSRVPGIPLKAHWRNPISTALAEYGGMQLDLRSEAYKQLGRTAETSTYLRVVTESANGKRTALSHFNKKYKGIFARALIRSGLTHGSLDSLIDWARSEGFAIDYGAPGELDLIIESV